MNSSPELGTQNSEPDAFTYLSTDGIDLFRLDLPMKAAIADWEQFVSRYAESSVDEFALEQLRPGDTLRVVTEHTDYVFTMDEDAQTWLSCSRADRPSGTVHISGCGFAFCHAFKPGHLFCGGRMEFTFLRGERPTRYRTTSIQTIVHEQPGVEELSFD